MLVADQAGQPNVTLGQVAKELGLNLSMLGRWRFELSSHGRKAFKGQGNPRDEELSALKRELARVKKERDFLREAAVGSTHQGNIMIHSIFGIFSKCSWRCVFRVVCG